MTVSVYDKLTGRAHFRKEQASRGCQREAAQQDKTRHEPHIKAGEVPSGGKGSWKPAKESGKGQRPCLLSGISPKHQSINHNIYAENLVQTRAGSTTAASVSEFHELRLVGSVVCVLLVSSTPLAPTILLPPFLQGSSVLSGGTWWRLLTWTLSPTNIWLWVSALALISCQRQPLWCDWTSH